MKKSLFIIFIVMIMLIPIRSYAEELTLKPGLNMIAFDLCGEDTETIPRECAGGDAALIEQNGNYLLIDTGYNYNANVGRLGNHVRDFLKKYGITKFSIYVSHYHNDHIGRIKELINDGSFEIEKIYVPDRAIITDYLQDEYSSATWYSGLEDQNNDTNNFIYNAVEGKNIPLETIKVGDTIEIGDAELKVIYDAYHSRTPRISPQDYLDMYQNHLTENNIDITIGTSNTFGKWEGQYLNDSSLVSKISYANKKILTAGDILFRSESDILEKNIDVKADIMKLSHHGEQDSNTSSFIDAVNPQYAYANTTDSSSINYWYASRTRNAFTTYRNRYTYNPNIAEFETYSDLVSSIASKTNLLATLYNGFITFNISPDGDISVDMGRNYITVVVKYVDENNNEIRENTIYHFNNITPVHLDLLDYKKDISNYQFVEEISSIENNTVLESDNNEIVLKYKKLANDKEDKINNPGTGTAIPFIFILIVILIGTIAISINKKKSNI